MPKFGSQKSSSSTQKTSAPKDVGGKWSVRKASNGRFVDPTRPGGSLRGVKRER